MAYIQSKHISKMLGNLSEDVEKLKKFKLSDLISKTKDERTGTTTYDISGPKAVGLLSSLVNVADPLGLGGGIGGLTFQSGYRGWNPKILESAQSLTDQLYKTFPQFKKVSWLTPALAMNPKFGRPGAIAEYIRPTRLRPWGTIPVYQPRLNPGSWIPHELLHAVEMNNPQVSQLAKDLFLQSPIGTEDWLRPVSTPRTKINEYFAYGMEPWLQDLLGITRSRNPLLEGLTREQAQSVFDLLSKIK